MSCRRLPDALLADVLGRLAVATGAGIDLRRAWASEAARVPAAWRPVFERVSRQLNAGVSLGDALTAAADAFPPVVRGMLAVGAETGHEPETFRALAAFLKRSAAHARPWRRLFARLPGIDAHRLADLATWSRGLALALGTGIDVGRAIELSTAAAPALAIDTDRLRAAIRGGLTLHEALDRCDLFPPPLIEAIAVGEMTGTVPERLERLADHFDEEATRRFQLAATTAAWTAWAAFALVVIIVVYRIFTGYLAILQDAGRPL